MIKWSDKYSVCHTGIDDQHKELIAIIQEVSLAIRKKDNSYTDIVDVIHKLENYIKVHFGYEENLMLEINYPDLEIHTKEHNELRYKIRNISVFDIEKPTEFHEEMLQYLMDWLINHIMQVDKKLGNYILEME